MDQRLYLTWDLRIDDFEMVVNNFNIIDFLNLDTAITVMLHSWILLRHYRQTKIKDFLYFAIFFRNSAVILSSIVLANHRRLTDFAFPSSECSIVV